MSLSCGITGMWHRRHALATSHRLWPSGMPPLLDVLAVVCLIATPIVHASPLTWSCVHDSLPEVLVPPVRSPQLYRPQSQWEGLDRGADDGHDAGSELGYATGN